MGDKSKIEWTGATFNPWWGCTEVSSEERGGGGCDNCYARDLATRWGYCWGHNAQRRYFDDKHWNEPRRWNRRAKTIGKRMKVFCGSMCDILDNEVEQKHRDRLWELALECDYLDWLMLTKRIGNAPAMYPGGWIENCFPCHIWPGITVVNQVEGDRDIGKLLKLRASIRWISVEPLLGSLDLTGWFYSDEPGGIASNKPEWVIVGGESGPHARPLRPKWARSIRDQCQAAGVPFFFKQWGEWVQSNAEVRNCSTDRIEIGGVVVSRVGKKAAGRLLDGQEWNEYPRVKTDA